MACPMQNPAHDAFLGGASILQTRTSASRKEQGTPRTMRHAGKNDTPRPSFGERCSRALDTQNMQGVVASALNCKPCALLATHIVNYADAALLKHGLDATERSHPSESLTTQSAVTQACITQRCRERHQIEHSHGSACAGTLPGRSA